MDLSNASKLISESLLTTAANIGGTKKQNQQNLSGVTKEMMRKQQESKDQKSLVNQIEYVELCKTI